METYANFVNGTWVESKSTQRVAHFNPADPSDVIGQVPVSTADEVRAAVDAAAPAFPQWREV